MSVEQKEDGGRLDVVMLVTLQDGQFIIRFDRYSSTQQYQSGRPTRTQRAAANLDEAFRIIRQEIEEANAPRFGVDFGPGIDRAGTI